MNPKPVQIRFLASQGDLEVATLAAEVTEARLSVMDSVDAVENIIALPTDLVVLNTSMVPEEDWDRLCAWLAEHPLDSRFFLITGVNLHANALPESRIINEPLSVAGLIRAIRQVDAMTSSLNRNLSYEEILSGVSQRAEEVTRFEVFLRNETSWLTSPASTRFHMSKAGGLVEHSLNVTNTMLKLRSLLAPEVSEESCIIAGLYHDTGKIGMPGKPYYIPNPSEWHVKNRGINYVVNNDLVYMDIATRSLFLVSRYITLTDEEAQAIRYHDGQYIEENHSVAHKETRLTRLLQYADNWSAGVIEAI